MNNQEKVGQIPKEEIITRKKMEDKMNEIIHVAKNSSLFEHKKKNMLTEHLDDFVEGQIFLFG